MYSNIIKGFTTGHTLTRRVLRNLTSIPGVLLDFIVAIFWVPNYQSYWNYTVPYADGTRVGILRGAFGWIGEALGLVVGPPLGIAIGLALFFPDAILRIITWAQRGIYKGFDRLAAKIGNSTLFENFSVFKKPANYFEKAWNIGVFFLGSLIAIVPVILAKTLQFFLPFLRNGLSWAITKSLGAVTGALMTALIATPVFPVQFLFRKLVDLYEGFSGVVRNAIALVYARTKQEPAKFGDTRLITLPNDTMHSPEFRQKVADYKSASWTSIVLGKLKDNTAADAGKDAATTTPTSPKPLAKITPIDDENFEDPALMDALSFDELGEEIVPDVDEPKNHAKDRHKPLPILVDKEGYSWNDYGATDTKGIRFFISSSLAKNPGAPIPHPITRANMTEADLVPNRALEEVLKVMRTRRNG